MKNLNNTTAKTIDGQYDANSKLTVRLDPECGNGDFQRERGSEGNQYEQTDGRAVVYREHGGIQGMAATAQSERHRCSVDRPDDEFSDSEDDDIAKDAFEEVVEADDENGTKGDQDDRV